MINQIVKNSLCDCIDP
uniref:Uncharacterized protein n=1 Tax=Arundo donax TaxID=35708 RepID=A0A0A8YVE6_ARUDO